MADSAEKKADNKSPREKFAEICRAFKEKQKDAFLDDIGVEQMREGVALFPLKVLYEHLKSLGYGGTRAALADWLAEKGLREKREQPPHLTGRRGRGGNKPGGGSPENSVDKSAASGQAAGGKTESHANSGKENQVDDGRKGGEGKPAASGQAAESGKGEPESGADDNASSCQAGAGGKLESKPASGVEKPAGSGKPVESGRHGMGKSSYKCGCGEFLLRLGQPADEGGELHYCSECKSVYALDAGVLVPLDKNGKRIKKGGVRFGGGNRPMTSAQREQAEKVKSMSDGGGKMNAMHFEEE